MIDTKKAREYYRVGCCGVCTRVISYLDEIDRLARELDVLSDAWTREGSPADWSADGLRPNYPKTWDSPQAERVRTLRAERDALKAKVESAITLLQRLEWSDAQERNDKLAYFCPSCAMPKRLGHDAICALAAILGSDR